MIVGYVRVSSIDQCEERQLVSMEKYNVEKIFSEKVSAKNTNRPELERMLDWVREGDTLVVHDFSRLARSTKDLLNIVEQLEKKKVDLISTKENIDTSTPTGKLMLTMIGAINEFERANLLERQREGIALAKAKGKYKGRKEIKIKDFEVKKVMKRHLKLPKGNSTLQSYEFNNNSLIIIGANGSGKSRFGAWIEKNDLNNVHRIGAQRSLQFDEYILLKSYKQAENLVLTGKEELDKNKSHRWSYGKYTNSLLRDFDAVLSALIAKKNLESDEYLKECKELEKNDEQHKPVPKNDIDKLYEIWNSIYPHRNIEIKDAQVKVKYKDMEYNGNEMSDGERVALYLICQCLVVPQGKILIIDEPEVHLHRSIMNILWREIEKNRPDCFFIYITHDTQFAAGHTHSKKIWLKDFDGDNWIWEFIDKTNLPEECLLDILGNRKNVLFVEGTQNSYDTKIY